MPSFKTGDKFTANKASFHRVTWTIKAINNRLKTVICTSNDVELPNRQFTFDELDKLRKL